MITLQLQLCQTKPDKDFDFWEVAWRKKKERESKNEYFEKSVMQYSQLSSCHEELQMTGRGAGDQLFAWAQLDLLFREGAEAEPG